MESHCPSRTLYGTTELPASLRSEIIRLRTGMPFAFPSGLAFAFNGIPSLPETPQFKCSREASPFPDAASLIQ